MKFDPQKYTILIRKEIHDAETFFVGRVREFENVEVYESSFQAAYEQTCEVLRSIALVASRKKMPMPKPQTIETDAFSGRVTLRFPRSLHRMLALMAMGGNID